jgi:hypothetical protein
MTGHKLHATIGKDGNLLITDLPFKEGTRIEVIISERTKKHGLKRLVENDHAWSDEDIKAVEQGREIINQWKIS